MSTPVKLTLPGLEEAGGGPICCRICLGGPFEEDPDHDALVSPCGCRGTQQFVHERCLRRWQLTPTSPHESGSGRRGIKCPVCLANYHAQYATGGIWLSHELRVRLAYGMFILCCLASLLLGIYVTKLPPVLGEELDLLPYERDSAPNAPTSSLLIATILWFGTVALGLSCLTRTGWLFGDPMRLAADPVPGLAAGSVLVATDKIGRPDGIFYESVLLLTRHDVTGSHGFVLNRPRPNRRGGLPSRSALNSASTSASVQQGLGGPVAPEEWSTLHGFPGVPGAVALTGGLFCGGDATVLRTRTQRAMADGPRWPRQMDERTPPVFVQVLHGHAAWAPAQLDGEVRAGVWKFAPTLGHEFAMCGSTDPRGVWRRATARVAAAGGVRF